jgi:hypothetical protein
MFATCFTRLQSGFASPTRCVHSVRIGNEHSIAVDYELLNVAEDWVFGRFCLFIGGMFVGDRDDVSVDLKGCRNWLVDFCTHARDRFEPGLMQAPKQQIFLQLAASVLVEQGASCFGGESYRDTFSRFHLSHLGMSSFNNVTLLLMRDQRDGARFIWQSADDEVQAAEVAYSEVVRVFASAAEAMSTEIAIALAP